MKIALVHSFLTKIGGAEKVLSVVHDMFPDAPIYTLVYDEKCVTELFQKSHPKIIASSLNSYPFWLKHRKKFLLSKYPQAIEQWNFSEYDIVISFSNAFTHGIITKPSTLHISYCYSPMRFVWDWYHEYLNENHIGINARGLYIRNLLSKIRIWDRLAADRVDRWIVQSKTAQERVKKYYRADSSIIYPPIDLSSIKSSNTSPEDFYLIVSRLEPYKKIDFVIECFNNINRKLIIIGEGSDYQRLKKLSKNNISFLGWQSNEAVYNYMNRSYAFIFPGEEDFGLTPIEAMAAGRPVIAYNKGGVTETVINGETGVFFDHQNASSLKEAIEKLDNIYSTITSQKCRNRSEIFSIRSFEKEFKAFIFKAYAEFTTR